MGSSLGILAQQHLQYACAIAVVDDTGEIWMLCLSQRLTTQRFASAPYHLWLTHSRNGKEWAPLRALQMRVNTPHPVIAAAQYQELPQMMRLPGGRFGIIWRDQFGAAKSPGEITSLQTLDLPRTDEKFSISNTQMTFESDGRCHLVCDDFGRGLYYTRSNDMLSWQPLQRLGLAEKNSSISKPQLVVEDEDVALIFERNNGSWLRRGTKVKEGLALGSEVPITDHTAPLNGSRLQMIGDRVLIPAGASPYIPNLLTAKFAELLKAPLVNRN